MGEKVKDEPICRRCGLPKSEHWMVNYADGPQISGAVLICPTSIFQEKKK